MATDTHTLAFIIDAPLQSWGIHSSFNRRDTESWPTKSALVGVLCAALGIDKHASTEAELIAPYAALRFSVLRWPKESSQPSRFIDFQTTGGGYDKSLAHEKRHIPSKAKDSSPFGTVITHRHYLTDARFIALFQGAPQTLESASAALLNPVWGIWFGRKTCIPTTPLTPTLGKDSKTALTNLFLKIGQDPTQLEQLSGLTEVSITPNHSDPVCEMFTQADQPVSFGAHFGALPKSHLTRFFRSLGRGELP